MSAPTSGPYKMAIFKCHNGEPCPGVMSERTGGAVCWSAGASDEECLANAIQIAKALNALDKHTVNGGINGLEVKP